MMVVIYKQKLIHMKVQSDFKSVIAHPSSHSETQMKLKRIRGSYPM